LGPKWVDIFTKIAKDPKYNPFFDYLDMLVEWVNANPQILNVEETIPDKFDADYPKIDKSFRTYSYINPYQSPARRLRNQCYDLERLKSSIVNEMAGVNASATVSNIITMPMGIQMPLSRQLYTNPVPLFNGMTFRGGADPSNVNAYLANINQSYGSNLFEIIYKDLLESMGLLSNNKLKLKYQTDSGIRAKLDSFKQQEEKFRKSLVTLIERHKLFQASRGHINSLDMNVVNDGEQLDFLMKKHSNIVQIGAAYNRSAINLIDLFNAVISAIQDKFKLEKDEYGVERPLTTGYHAKFPPPVIKK